MQPVDLDKLIPAERIVGEDAEETGLLQRTLQEATGYLKGFRWSPPIEQTYLGCGVGGVVAVFLFHFRERIQGTDEWLWVVVGDLPSAYLVLDDADNPVSALEGYCGLMEDWANAVLEGRSLDEVFPVEAKATPDNAKLLLKRIDFIRTRLLPDWRAEWNLGTQHATHGETGNVFSNRRNNIPVASPVNMGCTRWPEVRTRGDSRAFGRGCRRG